MTSKSRASQPSSRVVGENTEMPRPLKRIPSLADPADIRELRAAAKKFLGMSDRAAGAMSTMWVRPDQVRQQVENPRRMRIPGGNLIYIDGDVWTPRLMADPENPRNAAEYLYAMAGALPGSGDSAVSSSIRSDQAELIRSAASPEALLKDLDIAMEKTRKANTPYPPIGDQGIMDAPFGVMVVMEFQDGSAPIAVPCVKEGSTRISHAHKILDVSAEDTVMRLPGSAAPMTRFIELINELVAMPESDQSDETRGKIRCAIAPFTLIVGFEADRTEDDLDLAEAIKVKVAQEHLNTKQDWSVPAQHSVLADECLQAVFNGSLLNSSDEYQWLLGKMSRSDALAAGLGHHPDDRFARLIYLFTTPEKHVHDVIRRPIAFVLLKDAARTRAQVRRKTKVPLAVELAARELRGNPRYQDTAVDRIMKAMVNGALLSATAETVLTPMDRRINTLAKAVHKENSNGQIGPDGVELAMRALYYIALHDLLRVPRNDRSDRRAVGDVLATMLGIPAGIDTLIRIVEDGRAGIRPVRRDDLGEPILGSDGNPVTLTNAYLREQFSKGRVPDPNSEEEIDPFLQAQAEVNIAVLKLQEAMVVLATMTDDDGTPTVDAQGVIPRLAKGWRKALVDIRENIDDWFERGVEYWSSAAEPPASVWEQAQAAASASTVREQDTEDADTTLSA
ncbi:hypothetical protein ACWDOP_17690 [Nocardia sp. NPDC003693]